MECTELLRLLEVADAFLKKKASISQLRETVREAKNWQERETQTQTKKGEDSMNNIIEEYKAKHCPDIKECKLCKSGGMFKGIYCQEVENKFLKEFLRANGISLNDAIIAGVKKALRE